MCCLITPKGYEEKFEQNEIVPMYMMHISTYLLFPDTLDIFKIPII